jgi:hypothetical protein
MTRRSRDNVAVELGRESSTTSARHCNFGQETYKNKLDSDFTPYFRGMALPSAPIDCLMSKKARRDAVIIDSEVLLR